MRDMVELNVVFGSLAGCHIFVSFYTSGLATRSNYLTQVNHESEADVI